MSVARRPRPRRSLERDPPDRRGGRGACTPTRSIATPGSRPRRSTRCASAGALSAFVPTSSAAAGSRSRRSPGACFELGRRCSLDGDGLRHAPDPGGHDRAPPRRAPWFEGYLRELVGEQRLIASVTSEIGTGGDMGRSIAAGDARRGRRLSRSRSRRRRSATAPTPTICSPPLRRSPDAEQATRSSCCTTREQTELEPAGTWDTLGMRGTCSPGFVVRAQFAAEQVLAGAVRRGDEPVASCRCRTSCGRTCGWASPPRRSSAAGPSSGPRARRKPGSRSRRPRASHA